MVLMMMLMMLLGRYNIPNPPTLEKFVSLHLKSLETGLKRDIWKNWQRRSNKSSLDPTESERTEQIFYNNLFDKAEIFFNQTVPLVLDQAKAFLQKIQRGGDTSIGDFMVEHLLPVQMDTLIKFVKFLRCSWTPDTRNRSAERMLERWAKEYDPRTPSGLDGVDFGTDAGTIQKNLLDQVIKDLARQSGKL